MLLQKATARRRQLISVLALPFLACDPSYTLHLSTKVSAKGAPVGGAWVIPLSRKSSRNGTVFGVRTGPDGSVLSSRTEFLAQPIDDPIAVHAQSRPLCVVRPAAETTQRGRGIFFVTEYDAVLAVDLAGSKCAAARRIALACGDDKRCTIALDEPASSFCDGFVVSVTPESATATLVPENRVNGAETSPREWTIERPEGAAFVAVCTDRRGVVSVSVAE